MVKMDLRLSGKSAVLCGSSSGIGLAFAAQLAQEGVNIVINSRSESNCCRAVEYIKSKSDVEVLSFVGDLSDPNIPSALIKYASKLLGKVDILFCNSGGPPPLTFLETTDQHWSSAINTNFMAPVRLSQAVASSMMNNRFGRIILLGSSLMKEPTPSMVLSASTRAAATCFMKSISQELAPFGITVNTISTGGVRTDRLESLLKTVAEKQNNSLDEQLKIAASSIPIGRFSSPDEFVNLLTFLASEKASYITGECISVDGGLLKAAF